MNVPSRIRNSKRWRWRKVNADRWTWVDDKFKHYAGQWWTTDAKEFEEAWQYDVAHATDPGDPR